MTYLLVAVTVIALSELGRLYLTHHKLSKHRHFQQKRDAVQRTIWDLEFKRFKTEEIREDIRREYDSRKAVLFETEKATELLPKDRQHWTDEQKHLDDNVVRLKQDLERFERQMKALDEEVGGTRPTNENPQGVVGVTQQIDSYQELLGMLRDWMKRI